MSALPLLLQLLRQRWRRIAVTLVPLVFALLHVSGLLRLPVLERLDHLIYDARLRATLPGTLDERIVIVDIDEKSLERIGHWPWGRDKLTALADELFERQNVAIVGFDVVFAEADDSSGLRSLQHLAQHALRDQADFHTALQRLTPSLSYDARFAQAMAGRPAVLGYYFTSDREGRTKGTLPAPALPHDRLRGLPLTATHWTGYGSNLELLADAAAAAGFFNSITDSDGVVRSLPLLAEHGGQYYESLAMAMLRTLLGKPAMHPGFAAPQPHGTHDVLASIVLRDAGRDLELPVDQQLATLIPFRGPGGAAGGSFRYVSASDVIEGRLAADSLRDRIVLVGSTAPGLLDLRVTPVGAVYPGVETQANVLSAFLDGSNIVRPDYAVGVDSLQLLCAGIVLALSLPFLSATAAAAVSAGVIAALVATNLWLYLNHGLALPLSTALAMSALAFALNMVYGYYVESRAKRKLAALFGTYVPPELVQEMLKQPERYSMQAENRELTVMFCDMRGFTAMSERMEPLELQTLLNEVFSRLTHIIRHRQGTIDKYMGDCVMAFWGAPVTTPEHAHLAVTAALEMTTAVEQINAEHRVRGLPLIGVGIGLHTGVMCVGDMGSHLRRSYTVIGDAVNLGSRLEGLSKHYGTSIVASEATQAQAPDFLWQELDRVRVKGKSQAVAIYTPRTARAHASAQQQEEVSQWEACLAQYRSQNWAQTARLLALLTQNQADSVLYQLYAHRLEAQRNRPLDSAWDSATNFDSK
jgi:adenylate cyclase